jgi:hypothetical protein
LIGSRLLTHARLSTAILAIGLMLTTLACQLDVGGPEPPGETIPVSASAAEEMAQLWQSALAAAAATGTLTILLDEAQVTSFLDLRLEAQEDPVLHDPQVYLREGLVQVFGITERGPLQASVLVIVAPRLDEDGSVRFEVVSADVGPLPVPDALRQTISSLLTEAFTSPLGSLATGVRITTLAIADGQMALVGQIR